MSHMLYQKDTMFSVRETPWHGLGTVLGAAPSVSEAIKTAGLDWTVETRPVYDATGKVMPALAMFRNDDNSVLGVVGPNYSPLQNSEAFDFFQPFLDNGVAELETAGSLQNGRKIWVLAKIKNTTQDVVGGDPVNAYVLLSNSHDGTLAVRTGFTPIRVVCNNTLSAAIRKGRSPMLRIRHVGKVADTLAAVQETMNLATQQFEASIEQYRMLASKPITTADLNEYIKVVFATKSQKEAMENEDMVVEELNSGRKVAEEITGFFESGRGNDMPGVRGTYWAAYNAVNEYLNYSSGRSDDTRLASLWFGPNQNRNKEALKVALTMAGNE